MTFKSLLVFSIAFLFCNNLSSQQLPNYPERLFQDSLSTELETYPPISATDGAVDPNEYQVGPGDRLFISISGVKEIYKYLQYETMLLYSLHVIFNKSLAM